MITNFIKFMLPRKDAQGGMEISEEHAQAARRADLITLPSDVQGKNCSNCHHMNKVNSTCEHRDLLGVPVNARMACSLWYSPLIYEGYKHVVKTQKKR